MQYSADQFKKFIAPSGRTTPFVTFDINARIYFSSAATKLYKISDVKYKSAQIYYDKSSELIAIRLLQESIEGTLPIRSPQQGGAFINAKSFALEYEMMDGDKLSDEYKGKYIVEKGEIEGVGEIFIVKLNEKK